MEGQEVSKGKRRGDLTELDGVEEDEDGNPSAKMLDTSRDSSLEYGYEPGPITWTDVILFILFTVMVIYIGAIILSLV